MKANSWRASDLIEGGFARGCGQGSHHEARACRGDFRGDLPTDILPIAQRCIRRSWLPLVEWR